MQMMRGCMSSIKEAMCAILVFADQFEHVAVDIVKIVQEVYHETIKLKNQNVFLSSWSKKLSQSLFPAGFEPAT